MTKSTRPRIIDVALGAAIGATIATTVRGRGRGQPRAPSAPRPRARHYSREEFDRYLAQQVAREGPVSVTTAAVAPTPRPPLTVKVRTLAVLAVLAAIGAAAFVYLGIYNVAATEQHTAVVYHLLHYAMERSVSVRADKIKVPDLSAPEHAHQGFLLYREHCLKCHGAPGVEPEPFGFGLRPEPLDLAGKAGREWRPAEIYRVIKHGIKPTGMPAWQFRLSENDLWNLTAFVKQLPTISPRDYKAMDRAEPHAMPVETASATGLHDGEVKAGKYAMQQYLCTTCHSIPGVTGGKTTVGPPLGGIADRAYIGGVLLNTPENMKRWLRDPQQIDPLSGMPNLHIKEQDILDIVAFLYTLKK